jgi:hypothetical protein
MARLTACPDELIERRPVGQGVTAVTTDEPGLATAVELADLLPQPTFFGEA